jgi:hypothetical protein
MGGAVEMTTHLVECKVGNSNEDEQDGGCEGETSTSRSNWVSHGDCESTGGSMRLSEIVQM